MSAPNPVIERVFGRMETAPNRVQKHSPGPNPQIDLDDWRATVNGTRNKRIYTKLPLSERFWKKVIVAGPDECWLWSGATNEWGYGKFWNGQGLVMAHRMALELAGVIIPDGFVADHECHNISDCREYPCIHHRCCNPRHLIPRSQSENSIRGNTGDHNSVKTHCPRKHEYTPENTRIQIGCNGRPWRVCRACARIHSRNHQLSKAGKA